jgi:2-polyprenyl-3-methyl-5-hydroxy-6-metoxy-1,4-benzoquinol methylase
MIARQTISNNQDHKNDPLKAVGILSSEFASRKSCPLCNATSSKVQFTLDRFSIVRCLACDFLYVLNVLGEVAIQDQYKDGYDNQRHVQGQQVNASVNINVLGNLVPAVKNKSLLDVGSGYGFLLQSAASRFGMRVAGAELSIAEARFAQQKLGVKTYQDLFELPKDECFDVVTAFEVIEHVRDPVAFVQALIDRVKTGGHLIIATDNFESDVVRRLGEGFPKWIPHEHICFFSPKSLALLLGKFANLKVVGTCSFTPWELELRGILDRLSLGRVGRTSYQFGGFASELPDKGYRLFRTRLAVNSAWAGLSMKQGLGGEMMFICATKTGLQH